MPRPPRTPSTTRSSIAEAVPLIPLKEQTRDLVVTEPRYNDGVLEGMWRDRRVEKTKPCLLPFRGCSVYTTSYREPAQDAYLDDGAASDNRAKSEGVHRSILLEASGPKCRENFTTTTDLMHRWLPQVCPRERVFNSRSFEWLPSQNLLPCLGNLTQYGLKERLAQRWAEERASLLSKPVTTHHAHYHAPCAAHRETSRSAICRLFSSSLHSNNKILCDQLFRGQQVLVAPSVLLGQYPLDVQRHRLPIVPELPLEPLEPPAAPDRPDSYCTGVSSCRRVPGATPATAPATAPALRYYHAPCRATAAVGLL